MAEEKKKKSVVANIFIILLYAFVIVFLGSAIIMNIVKKDNEIMSFFGYCLAMVQSGSMVDGGFNVGDFVLIKECNTDTIKVGDIIVFYNCSDEADDYFSKNSFYEEYKLTNISEKVNNGTYVDFYEDDSELHRSPQSLAIDKGAILIFHRVIDIYVDSYGVRFFETKGDSNSSADSTLVRETFVGAKYMGTSKVFSAIFSFLVSSIGLIIIILIPMGYIIISQIISFIKEVKNYSLVGNLLTRKIKLKDIDTSKIKIQKYLSPPEKIYLYDITSKYEKNDMAIIIWDESIDEVLKVYEKDREEYYDYLGVNLSKKDQEKLELYKIKADIIKSNININDDVATERAKEIYRSKNVNNGK